MLIRPHPANAKLWTDVDFREPGRTAIWPRAGAKPTSDERKAEYYDSIYYSAGIVGINTSALVESSILGRPVFTVLEPELASAQAGMLHFAHLSGSDGDGLLRVAHGLEEHGRQLAAALRAPDATSARSASFVESFLRPRGLDVAARDLLVDALERLMERGTAARAHARPGDRLLRAAAQPAALAVVASRASYPGRATARTWRRRLERRRSARTLHQPRPDARWRRILFVIDHPGMLIHFDETVAELVERGHRVELAFARPRKYPIGLETIPLGSPSLTVSDAPPRTDHYTGLVRGLRHLADYVHYLNPSLGDAAAARAKWRGLAEFPLGLRWLERREALPAPRVWQLLRLLSDAEQAVPTDRGIDRFLRRRDPDLVIVTPLVDARTDLTDYVRSARRLDIPSALCVASWDNLSSKGLVRGQPDRLTVWNETQRWEAGEYHGIAPERVVVTGSQPHDRWFDRTPETTREAFVAQFGLPADAPYVLFVGSTKQGQRPEAEVDFVREWVRALRASDDPAIRGLSVLVRPHPTNAVGWADADLSEFDRLHIWMRDQALPILADGRSAYFDSLHHAAAIVGINSSAMIEAAIIGRPIHTLAMPEWRHMQRDLLHFRYLLPENGGFLREAHDLDEHVELLSGDLADPSRWEGPQREFVRRFLRPAGLDQPATPRLVDAIESFAAGTPEAREVTPAYAVMRAGTVAGVVALKSYIVANRVGIRAAKRASNLLARHAGEQPQVRRLAKAARGQESEFRARLSRVGASAPPKPVDLDVWLESFNRDGKPKAPRAAAASGNGQTQTAPSSERVP